MKEHSLRYQISLFGNYDEINPNPETIKIFLDMFSDKAFIPNISNEINIELGNSEPLRKNIAKLRLSASDNSWNISFGSERIDIILTNINIGTYEMPTFDSFIEDCEDFIDRIDKKYSKKHRRIGVINNVLFDDLNANSIQNKLNNNILFFKDQDLIDWTNRVASRKTIFEKDVLNAVSELRRIITPMIMNSKQTNFDGLILNIDVNTIDENKNYRFDISNISSYIEEMSNIQKEIYNQTIELIN